MRKIVAAVTLTLLLASCSKHEGDTVLIVYTGNVHGAILPYDFKNDTASGFSLANASTFIHDLRTVYGEDNVLTLDVGGTLTGRAEPFYFNFIDTLTEPIYYRAERLIDYDAIGIAQRDMDVTECLEPRRRSPDYHRPLLCANLLDLRTGKPYFKPYDVFNRGGLKIAVLGLTSPEMSIWLPKSEWQYIQTIDMIESAQEWVPYIQKHEHPDILIGLFGSSRRYESRANGIDRDTYKNPNGGLPTAMAVAGFDLVILADDRDPQSYDITNDAGQEVRVVNVGVLAQNVGSTLIHVRRNADGTRQKIAFTNITRTSRYAPDQRFVDGFADDFEAIYRWMNKPLARIDAPILPQIGICGPTPYRALLHEAQLWYTGADVSLTSILTDMQVVPPGIITMRSLLDIYKFENLVITITMTGEELHRLLEYTYSQQINQMRSPDDELLNLVHDHKGIVARNRAGHPYLVTAQSNFISAAGIHYVVDARRPAGERVTITTMRDGTPFDVRRTYTVAINSYHGTGGGGVLTNGIGWNTETLHMHVVAGTPVNIRYAIAQYLEHIGTFHVDYANSEWHLEPEEWVLRARERGRHEPIPIY